MRVVSGLPTGLSGKNGVEQFLTFRQESVGQFLTFRQESVGLGRPVWVTHFLQNAVPLHVSVFPAVLPFLGTRQCATLNHFLAGSDRFRLQGRG